MKSTANFHDLFDGLSQFCLPTNSRLGLSFAKLSDGVGPCQIISKLGENEKHMQPDVLFKHHHFLNMLWYLYRLQRFWVVHAMQRKS